MSGQRSLPLASRLLLRQWKAGELRVLVRCHGIPT